MRTTLVLDDHLLRDAKRRAAERNTTLSAVVNDALRESLRERPTERRSFRLITHGDPEKRVRHEPVDFKDVLEEDDLARLR